MIQKSRKKSQVFFCNFCDYSSGNNYDYQKHLETEKHKKREMIHSKVRKDTTATFLKPHTNEYQCLCGNVYKHHSGLWRHRKTCVIANTTTTIVSSTSTADTSNSISGMTAETIVKLLIKENNDMKDLLLKALGTIETIGNATHTTTHITSGDNTIIGNNNQTIYNTNQTFNLNVFLNETCKDAMNISDFAEKIKLQLPDLERFAELGYIKGITDVIVSNLTAIDVTKRPIHCTDQKREVIYVKDNGVWNKDDDRSKIKKLIDWIEIKQSKLIPLYREKYPDYKNPESHMSDKYSKMVIEVAGGKGDNDLEKRNKIIRGIIKHVPAKHLII